MFFKQHASNQESRQKAINLVVSISTDYVVSALVTYSAGKMILLALVREDELLRKNTNIENISNAVLQSIDKSVERIIHKELPRIISNKTYTGPSKIDEVHYLLASPWVVTQSKTIEINYDSPVRITDDIVGGILQREQDILENELFDNDPNKTPKTICFEQKILDIRCNGYSTVTIQDVIANSIQISFAMSISSTTIIENIRKSVHKYLHPTKEEFHSALLGEFYALKDGKNSMSEAIFLRLLGESTDILLIKHGIPAHVATFACGTHTLARKLAKDHDMQNSNAHDAFTKNDNSGDYKLVENNITEAINIWRDYLIKTVDDMGITTDMPQNIFISGESAFLDKCIPAIKDKYQSTVVEGANYDHIESNIIFADESAHDDHVDSRTMSLVYSIGKLTK